MTRQAFNEAEWIEDLAVALEQVAAEAQPSYYPLPVETSGYRSSAERRSVLRRGYGALAARAKHDPTASIQFRESYLQIRSEPVEAIAILRKHPLMKPGLEGSARDESIGFRVLGRSFSSNLRGFVERLAKLSVKEGGVAAARRLHRYLTAGANGAVPAHEITVIHGLVVKTRFKLYAGAYVAPYGDARTEFELPHEPEPMSKNSLPDAAVLVRSLEYGPGVAPLDQDPGLPDVQVTYRFPAQYRVDLEGWFDERALLVDLLSIAARAPLLARTRYVRVARWIDEINPNFAFGAQDSQGFVSDVWPQGHELSKGDIDAFLGMARGWRKWPHRVGSMDLAIRRVAGSFSRPGGRFGQEDRILDVAIALEVLYGGETGHKLSERAAGLLGATAKEQKRIYDQAKGFYGVRSKIVHWKSPSPSRDALDRELEAGRNLACCTLANLLIRDEPPEWAAMMRSLLPEAQAYIAATRSQRDK